MKINAVSNALLGMPTIFFAPEDEGAGGGGGATDDADAGNETTTNDDADGVKTGGTALDDEPGEGESEGGDADKKDESSDEDGDAKSDDDDKGAEVPEDGSYEFDLPDGIELNDEDRTKWSETFKDLGLTRDQAKRLTEMQVEQLQQEQKSYGEFIAKQQSDQEKAAKADPEIGGDKWEDTKATAQRALKVMGGEGALKKLILSTGNGNNPEILRELRKIGQNFKDDEFEPGKSHEEPKSLEANWYGDTTPDKKKG